MGALFKVPAIIIYFVGGLWGLFISLGIVSKALGFIGGVIAFMFFPVTLYFAPWYAALADGNWFPVGVVYGSGLVALALGAIGHAVDPK